MRGVRYRSIVDHDIGLEPRDGTVHCAGIEEISLDVFIGKWISDITQARAVILPTGEINADGSVTGGFKGLDDVLANLPLAAGDENTHPADIIAQ